MASRKNIEVFSVSFLDLLSGALAAVIILFIIVPKLDAKSKEAGQKLDELGLEVKQLDSIVNALENSVEKEIFESIQQQLEEIQKQLEETKTVINQLEQEKKEVEALKDRYLEYKKWMDNCGLVLADKCPPKAAAAVAKNVGFNFKGKNVIFLIDASGSMEERSKLESVKAGLKMLIATMEPNFKIDVVQFPYMPDNATIYAFRPGWGSLQSATEENKLIAYNFIYSIKAKGSTPTRDALKYALENYPTASDIVLLTDGIPTLTDGSAEDDVDEIIAMVDQMNTNAVKINTIGVGEEFFLNQNYETVAFLRLLSERNGPGFFIGF